MYKMIILICALALSAFAGSTALAGSSGDILVDGQDFNDDGNADVVTTSTDFVKIQLMDGIATVGSPLFVSTSGGAFPLRAIGDVNGDNFADLMLEGASFVKIVPITGTATTLSEGTAEFLSNGGGSFLLDGVGKLDAGDTTDLVFNSSGAFIRINLSDGASLVNGTSGFVSNGGGTFDVDLVGDVTGDSMADLIADDETAFFRVTKMNGVADQGNAFISSGGGEFRAIATGDSGDDDTQDIFAMGMTGIFDRVNVMSGVGCAGGAVSCSTAQGFVSNGGGTYPIGRVGDATGDSKVDIFSDGGASGFVRVVPMDGATPGSATFVSNGGGTFSMASSGDLNNDDSSDLYFDGASFTRVNTLVNGASTGQGFAGNGGGTFQVFD